MICGDGAIAVSEMQNEDLYLVKRVAIDFDGDQGTFAAGENGLIAYIERGFSGDIKVFGDDDVYNGTVSTKRWVDFMVITPDEKKMAVFGFRKDVTIWSIPDGKLLCDLKILSMIYSRYCVVITDDRIIYSTKKNTLLVRDIYSGIELHSLAIDSIPKCIVGSFQKNECLLSFFDASVKIMDIESGKITRQHDRKYAITTARATAINPQYLINSLDCDNLLSIWDSIENTVLRVLSYSCSMSGLDDFAYDPYRNTLVFPLNGGLILVEEDRGPSMLLEPTKQSLGNLSFHKHGTLLYSFDDSFLYVFSMNMHPFWNVVNHKSFAREEKDCIKVLLIENMIKKKRKREPERRFPREILYHIFSFVRRGQ